MTTRVAEAGPSRPIEAGAKHMSFDLGATLSDDGGNGSVGSVSDGSMSGSESESESTDQEYQDAVASSPVTKGKAPFSPNKSPAMSPSKKGSSWADLDLSIIVALVSPIGNWLTGGDHIKNIFLIILLIFYLHQIIEIPWQLYLGARPRRKGHRVSSHDAGEDEKTSDIAALAEGELRKHEFAYLALSVASPFIGALFLRHVLFSLGEQNILSWFSTTLFVLATGIRPWSHFINRLKKRTHELHTALHYPDEDSLVYLYEETNKALRVALKRVDTVEREVYALREDLTRCEQLRELCDELSEVVSELGRSGKRYERKSDAGRAAQSMRITALEQGLAQVEERRRRDVAAFEAAGIHLPQTDKFLKRVRSSLSMVVEKLLYFPRAIILFGLEDPHMPVSHRDIHLHLPGTNGHANGNGASHHSRGIRSPEREKHIPHLVPRLETIPEADDSDSEETFVSDKEAPSNPNGTSPPHKRPRRKSLSLGSSSASHIRKASTLGQKVFRFAQNLVLWPYRFSVRVLIAILPPVRNVMPDT